MLSYRTLAGALHFWPRLSLSRLCGPSEEHRLAFIHSLTHSVIHSFSGLVIYSTNVIEGDEMGLVLGVEENITQRSV